MTPQTLQRLLEAQSSGPAAVLATRLSDGTQFILPDQPAIAGLQDAASLALARDDSRIAEVDGERWFLQVHAPAYRLLVVGAVHGRTGAGHSRRPSRLRGDHHRPAATLRDSGALPRRHPLARLAGRGDRRPLRR